MVQAIPIEIRAKIYTYLGNDRLNVAQVSTFRFVCESADEWFDDAAIRPELRDRVQRALYRRGSFLVFADLRLVVPELRDAEELAALFKVLTRVKTFIVTLDVDEDSDVGALVRYWGGNGRAKDVRPLLESLVLQSNGGSLDISHLFPPSLVVAFTRIRCCQRTLSASTKTATGRHTIFST